MAPGPGPDGVAVVDGVVYGDSSTAAFALSAATGKPIWRDRGLLSKGQGSLEIQPQVANGRVYLASAYGSGPGGGVLFALEQSGKIPFTRTWPLIIIVVGLMKLLERLVAPPSAFPPAGGPVR